MTLAQFLVKAKKKTYASEGEGGEKIKEDGCKELMFEKDNFKYRDRYYGVNPFIGEEVVFRNDKAVWVMNYCGAVISSDVNVKNIYTFLKKAMSQIKESRPFRGPAEYIDGDYKYIDSSDGDINNFTGTEEISYQGEKVYKLSYHGCSIQK